MDKKIIQLAEENKLDELVKTLAEVENAEVSRDLINISHFHLNISHSLTDLKVEIKYKFLIRQVAFATLI